MRYLEDFAPGQEFDLGTRAVTRDEIVAYARMFDPQPFHIDEAAAARSIYGGLIASGWHTVSLFMRLLVDGLLRDSAGMGSPGVDEVRWPNPVRPGDVLSARAVVDAVRPSRSRPDRGVVRTRYAMRNQDGAPVLAMKGVGMFRRRNPPAAGR